MWLSGIHLVPFGWIPATNRGDDRRGNGSLLPQTCRDNERGTNPHCALAAHDGLGNPHPAAKPKAIPKRKLFPLMPVHYVIKIRFKYEDIYAFISSNILLLPLGR